MTGDKKYLKEVRSYSEGCVTFGDGVKGRIKGIGRLASPDSRCLDDLLLVEGLAANFISISQLCEQSLNVQFNNSECTIVKGQEVLMRGTKSKDKCYLWTPQNKSQSIACLSAKEGDTKMSHKMVQHLCTTTEVESIQTDIEKGTLALANMSQESPKRKNVENKNEAERHAEDTSSQNPMVSKSSVDHQEIIVNRVPVNMVLPSE
ncbi:gag-pol polyprotein, partial [Trifolium medium]|nr:gag-pol polyprotein [Trifolium medium]